MSDRDLFFEQAIASSDLVDAEALEAARRLVAEENISLVAALLRNETLTPREVGVIKADACEVPFVDLEEFDPCYANTALMPRAIADRHSAFPLFVLDGVLTLAMENPLNLDATDQIRRVVKLEVDTVLANPGQIHELIQKAYSLGHDREQSEQLQVKPQDDPDQSSQPVVAAVNQMLADGVQLRASDVHVNPDDRTLHLRYRIDGVLQERQAPPLSMHSAIVQRLKVMSHLDLTQTRRPQDGKFRFMHRGQHIEVRVSTMPTVSGENVVLRLLANAQVYTDFFSLGMPTPVVDEIEEVLHHPYGMLLVTGPTGSGKTTTLYTALGKLNDPERNVMTIEDPVEIRLPYLRQIQVNPDIGLTFASALRSMLRQDPDIVLVGEIRDNETATIALQAALTGHLVLSTLHTNDAVGAVARLRDYGLPSFVINSAVLGVIAQRLVRRVCSHCVTEDVVDAVLSRRFSLEDGDDGFVAGRGCSRCGQTGYRGRVGLYEFLRFTQEVRRLVEAGGDTDLIRRDAARRGMRPIWQDGLEKARLGQTTLAEVAKVASVIDLANAVTDTRLVA